ncbi:MAG: hypothetical protein KAU21_05200, partial [Gammaproteobacteria bacterium]|nr:hypothetical protein [Gammaproteobacteria bacterium]
KLSATTYDDGTGVATSVIYDEAVQGPISDEPVPLVNDVNVKTFSVLGMAISINALTTRFKSEDNVDFSFDNISQGDVVEVSGFVDQHTNSIIATHIEKIGTLADGNNQVELHGVIEDLAEDNSSFSMNGIIIDSSQVMEDHLEDLNTLVNGLFVEVHGEYQQGGTILATEIEGEEGNSEEITSSDGYLSLQGFITSFTSTSEFSVNGVPVFLDTADISEDVLNQLEEGIQVEVQGFMEEGILQVDEIEIESGS